MAGASAPVAINRFQVSDLVDHDAAPFTRWRKTSRAGPTVLVHESLLAIIFEAKNMRTSKASMPSVGEFNWLPTLYGLPQNVVVSHGKLPSKEWEN